ncbi:membrane protein [Prolixibacter bellariivorans]|uniref:Membrane protein n=1 Tax=Prolixibacter bellariivorans TaxID=314319 RepID=A0A5M4B3L8_9BACT|nr:AsmA-like C-terminal region-containing protein [Prolixibacter bellariivorans]GET34759.1 membrane protein [Prolixibacter bellariivorans]
MKKALIIIGIVVVVLLAAMIAVPLIFKDQIYKKALDKANEMVDAKVELDGVNLSLFKSFPKVYAELDGLRIIGKGDFANDTLVSVGSVATTINLSSLWHMDEGIDVNEIIVDNPKVSLKVNKTGKSNWDITTPSEQPATTDTTASEMQLNLDKISVHNLSLSYTDESTPMSFSMNEGDFNLSGTMDGANSTLKTDAQVKNITFDYQGSRYAKDISLDMKTVLTANFDKMKFAVAENETHINKLPVKIDGSFAIGDSSYDFDLKFSSPGSGFNELLGFVPEEYQSYLKDVQTKGNVAFGGFVKGAYTETSYPAFGIDLKLDNGWLKYPDLPKAVENINLAASVKKPEGDLDLMTVNVNKFEANAAGNPVSANLSIAHPMSDMQLKGKLNGKIDFTTVAQALPMDSMDIRGLLDAAVQFNGPYSAIDKQQYDKFETEGKVQLKGFRMVSKDLPMPITISSADMTMNSRSVSLASLKGNMGHSDFSASGSLSNYWPYILKNETLKGNLKVSSNLLDVNQLMASMATTDTAKTDTTKMEAIEVPNHLDFVMQANINKILYDKMVITGTKGQVIVRNKKLLLDGLNMNMLNGQVTMNGSYEMPQPQKPKFDFNLKVKGFDIPQAYRSLSTVRTMLPIASNSTGEFSTGLSISGFLTKNMEPVFQSFNGNGDISTSDIQIVGAKVFQEIGKYFKKNKFDKVDIDNFATKFKIVNGGLDVSPFKTKIAGQEAVVSGHQTVSQDLDYKIDFKVNKNDLSGDINKYLGFVPGTENIKKLPVGVTIGGTFKQPEVKVNLNDAKKLVEQEFKKSSKKQIQDAAKKLGNELNKLFK